ncbi:MAG: pyridoxamine 5'-phosphate oxidase family protein [Planctomycetota bacterium]
MAKFYSEMDESHQDFIQSQKIFFVASAPRDGRVNVSPKGMDTFRIISPTRVAYLDLTGSGNETAAHLRENGRLTLMFCSFETKPLILRLYGTGRVILPREPEWNEWHAQFTALPGERQIFVLAVEAVQTSCGMAVPFYDFVSERRSLADWAEKQGTEKLGDYWRLKNRVSIDGLPTGLIEE